jgi:hypothetical protein
MRILASSLGILLFMPFLVQAQYSSCRPYYPSYNSYSYPNYQSYTPYYPTKEVVIKEQTYIQPVVVQEKYVPAFVFQVLQAYNPSGAAPAVSMTGLPASAPLPTVAPTPGTQVSAQTVSSTTPTAGTVVATPSPEELEERIVRRIAAMLRAEKSESLRSSPDAPLTDSLPVLESFADLAPPSTSFAAPPSPPTQKSDASVSLQTAVNNLHFACNSCHGAQNPKAGLRLFNERGELSPFFLTKNQPLAPQKLLEVIDPNSPGGPSMPPPDSGKPKISLQDFNALKQSLIRS